MSTDRDGQISHSYSFNRAVEDDGDQGKTSLVRRALAFLPKIFMIIIFLVAVYYTLEVGTGKKA